MRFVMSTDEGEDETQVPRRVPELLDERRRPEDGEDAGRPRGRASRNAVGRLARGLPAQVRRTPELHSRAAGPPGRPLGRSPAPRSAPTVGPVPRCVWTRNVPTKARPGIHAPPRRAKPAARSTKRKSGRTIACGPHAWLTRPGPT